MTLGSTSSLRFADAPSERHAPDTPPDAAPHRGRGVTGEAGQGPLRARQEWHPQDAWGAAGGWVTGSARAALRTCCPFRSQNPRRRTRPGADGTSAHWAVRVDVQGMYNVRSVMHRRVFTTGRVI